MRNHLKQLKALHACLAQIVRAVIPLLVEEGNQDVGYIQLFLLGGLALQDGALQNALETYGLGGFRVFGDRNLLLEVVLHPVAYLVHVGAAGAEYALHLVERQSGVQDVLRREVFMVPYLRLVVRGVYDSLHVAADLHGSSVSLMPSRRCSATGIRGCEPSNEPAPLWWTRYPKDSCRPFPVPCDARPT